MNTLILLLIIPFLTVVGILFSKGKQVRVTSAIGMSFQLLASFVLLFEYLGIRNSGNTEEMVLMQSYTWYETFNIGFTIGVDGISVSLIVLTGIVIFTGIFASWNVDNLSKEFFISLILLASGVFGFFISLDLFTMFLFYEMAVIPMYLLIGIWGSGNKEY